MIRLGTSADLAAASSVYRRASLSNAGDRDDLLAYPEYLILGPEGLAEGRTYVGEENGSITGFATWAGTGRTRATTTVLSCPAADEDGRGTRRPEASARSAELSDPPYMLLNMDWKIELVAIPVTDVDRAKEFYVDRVGFHADHDYQVADTLRFVQLTPPGSACSIVLGTGTTEMAPGSQKGVQVVVADVEAARRELIAHGVQASEVDVQPWGSFVTFSDPDGNTWALQQLPTR